MENNPDIFIGTAVDVPHTSRHVLIINEGRMLHFENAKRRPASEHQMSIDYEFEREMK